MPWFVVRMPSKITYELELEAENEDEAYDLAETEFEKGNYTREYDWEPMFDKMIVREMDD